MIENKLSEIQWKKLKDEYDKDFEKYWTYKDKVKFGPISMEEFKKRYSNSIELQNKYTIK
jgi:hypothetical protein